MYMQMSQYGRCSLPNISIAMSPKNGVLAGVLLKLQLTSCITTCRQWCVGFTFLWWNLNSSTPPTLCCLPFVCQRNCWNLSPLSCVFISDSDQLQVEANN